MSIIIRLQNLPWNANAADIRQFFQNLTIPDGGVHIVGGENGDAFIAFGSDEDARQAMLLDGGKIKDSKIKLLLSSRTEMQKVIELAKQQAITLQNLMQSMAAASTFGTTPLSMLPNMLSGISGLPNLPQLPVTGSNTVTPAITAIPAPPTSHELKEVKAAQMENKTVASKDGKSKESDKTRSSSRSVSRSRSRSRSRDRRYRDRYRYRNRSRDRKWHRDRSRSKDRDRKNSRSRSRDRYKRRSRSRDKRSRDRDHKAKDKRAKTHDKKEKSPIVIKDGKPSQTKTTVDMKSKPLFGGKKNEITSVDAIPLLGDDISSPKLSDCFNIDSKSFPLANKPKPITPQIQIKLNSNGSPKTEPKTETDSKTSWMNSVPMPPMISSWMLSQTNDKPIKEEENKDDKNKPANVTNGDEKVDTAAPIPFGMFAPQFPFGPGFPPPPPAMYPFAAGYPNPAAPQFMGADQAMPAMQVPAFFNPYQTASPVLPGTPTQPNTSPSTMKNNIEPHDKLPRMENDEDVKTDQRNNYDNHDYDYSRKYSKPNNYYSEGYNDKNYSTGGGFKRDDYKSDREYDSYDKPHGYPNRNSENDEEPYRKPYSRRNFMDENYDRRDTYEHGDSRKYAPSFPLSYPGSVCAEVVNLPRDANVIDIKKFFSPLPLYESSIKFQSDGKGNKTRNAYVKFLNINHKLQALKYSGKIIRGYRVTVSDMDPTVYEAAEDYTIAAVEQQFLKVSFIPKRARRQDVLNAFPNAPDDMIVMKDRNKDSLVAYIKFASSAMVKSALADKHKILISNSRVKLEPITEEEYLIARADYQISEDSLDNDDDINENTVVENVKTDKMSKPSTNARWNEVNSESNDETSNDRKYEVEEYEPQNKVFKSNCILMKNLPLNITDREIVDFFADINVVPSQIHIMFDNDYKQTGDTFCEFSDEHQAFEALSKNNLTLNDKRVTITIVPREDVLRAIGAPLPEKHFPNSRFNLPPIPKKSYPPPVRPRMPFGGPGPRHMPPRGPPAMPVRRPPGPEHFGKPGCVVGLENIPYKADVDEILEFFGHFDVQRENIIRRFNENGQATGDARVCLKNPIEAQKAIQQLDGKRIRDRVIFVNLVK